MSIELLNKLPRAAQAMWTATSNEAKAKYGESRANKIAWSTIKSKFNKVNETWVAKSSDFNTYEVVRYEFVADEASVSKDSEGFSTIDYILASGKFDGHNQQFGQLALTSMVTQINEEGLVGRLETDGRHELWKQLAKEDLTPEEIEERLQSLDTGIKAISARLDGNKVVAKVKSKVRC